LASSDVTISLSFLPNYTLVCQISGRFDINHQRYQCLKCNKLICTSEPVVVTQSGFWPGSIRDMTYVFDQDLFLYWDLLQKQIPGVSEHSFLKSLELFSKRKGRVSTKIEDYQSLEMWLLISSCMLLIGCIWCIMLQQFNSLLLIPAKWTLYSGCTM